MHKRILTFLFLGAFSAKAMIYSTSFGLTENPISESSNWTNGATTGLDWKDCRTTPGRAFGTQSSGDTGFDDSTAIVRGPWGSNQTVSATVFVDANSDTGNQEVELRLRTTIGPHSITGYEITFSCKASNPYVQIVRWLGPVGVEHVGFEYISQSDHTHFVQNGDVIMATINGTTINVYINGVLILTATDANIANGFPGMGFYLDNTVNPAHYGLTQFFASDGNTNTVNTLTGQTGTVTTLRATK